MFVKPIRLQKFIADCGLMSRRSAEKEILAGKIKVNGTVASLGDKVTILDEVIYQGKHLKYPSEGTLHTYIMLNKPKGYITTLKDEKNRKCILDLISDVGHRVYPIGRLDYESEGLLLLTDDGELTNALTHPSGHIPKVYHVKTKDEIVDVNKVVKNLSKPIDIDGYITSPALCKLIHSNTDGNTFEITLYEGRNRQIRRLFEREGITIKSLKRISIGDIKLGQLPPGKWKKLSNSQIEYLKKYKKK